MPATLLDIVDKTYSKKHALLHFVYLRIRCTGLKTFFFFSREKKLQKYTKMETKTEVMWTGNWKMAIAWLYNRENTSEFKSILGLVLWIYIEILHIFYIYFFLSRCWRVCHALLPRARPCPTTSPTNYWQGLDEGSLTCTLIGWHSAFNGNSASVE